MHIGYISDLHLDVNRIEEDLFKGEGGKVLIVAGDVAEIREADIFQAFLFTVSKQFDNVLLVAGNHEFYCSDINEAMADLRAMVSNYPNIHLFDNTAATIHTVIDGVSFIGATLWTNFGESPINELAGSQFMNDFRLIRNGDQRFTTKDSIQHHRDQLDLIRREMMVAKECGRKIVVISHHAPSFQSVHPRYHTGRGAAYNNAFYSDLDDIILTYAPDFWVHGHTHDRFNYMIGDCNVLCNPYGYPGENRGHLPEILHFDV